MKQTYIVNCKKAAREYCDRLPRAHRIRLWAAPLITAAATAGAVCYAKTAMPQAAAMLATMAAVGTTMTAGSYANVSPMGWARVTGFVAAEFAVSSGCFQAIGNSSFAAFMAINAVNFAAIAWAKRREARAFEKLDLPCSFDPLIFSSLGFSPTLSPKRSLASTRTAPTDLRR